MTKIKIQNKIFTVGNANSLIDNKDNGLTCPKHIYNFVRYQPAYGCVNCNYCGEVYKVQEIIQ